MNSLKKFPAKIMSKPEVLILGLFFLFVAVNWIMLSRAEELGPPDFYKLFGVAEKLYAGDLKTDIIPPLFVLLLYPLGKLLSLFVAPGEAYILAGRLIAFAASLGVLWFSYLLLKKITGKWAWLGLVFLVISPWYLKLISFPITDMLYLFFVAVSFYTFFNQSAAGLSLAAVIAGVLTRFEGVLLILSGIINYFKIKKRFVYILLGLIPLVSGLFLLFMPRIFAHLTDIILPQQSYLFIFQHPLEFFNVIYGSIFFFIPYNFPYVVKMGALVLFFIFFVYGVYRLFKINKTFTFSLLVYELLFLVAKGYIDTAAPEREFRRIFSGLWIFYIIGFSGCYFLLKRCKDYRILRNIVLVGGGFFFLVMVISLEIIPPLFLLPAFLLIIPLVYPVKGLFLGRSAKYLSVIVLLAFLFQAYYLSYRRAEAYVVSYANKAAYAAAQWLNHGSPKPGAVVLSYTNNTMMHYYLDKKKIEPWNLQWLDFTVPLRYEQDRVRFKELFFNLLQENRVDYIIFDNYVVQKPEFAGINDVQRLLFEERENRAYFKLKYLFYKGQNVAYVLRPVLKPSPRTNAETNH
jgi:hypothetical protein